LFFFFEIELKFIFFIVKTEIPDAQIKISGGTQQGATCGAFVEDDMRGVRKTNKKRGDTLIGIL
jgi:hypothetical protein